MAIEIENELTLRDYLSIVRRRWLLILTTFLLSWVVISAFWLSAPSVYIAEGLVLIESPTISKAIIGGDLGQVSAAKYVDEHVDKVKQEILSRENLIRLNKEYSLFPNLTQASMASDALKKSIKIVSQIKSSDGTAWSEKVTVGFTVGFTYSDADKTYKVANDMITQLLNQNTKDRTRRATETTSFLTAELDALKSELEMVENKVAEYKQKHSGSLPEHQQLHMTSLDQMRGSLKDLDIEYKTAQEELRYLDVELMTAHATINKADTSGAPATVSKLEKARAELDRSMVLYKNTHPAIRALKRKVALLEKEKLAPVSEKPKKVNVAGELAIAKINSQIEAAKTRLGSISQEKRSVRSQIATLKNQVVKIPQVERGLVTLLRGYENSKRKYEDVKAKQVNAKIAENLELDNKAERFVLIESPVYPEYKKSMRKSKILILGFLASIAIGLGLAMLLEILDKRVRGQAVLAQVINAKPLAIIPYISTQAELNQKRKVVKSIYYFIAALICSLVILAIIHFFVAPLDTLPVLGLLGIDYGKN